MITLTTIAWHNPLLQGLIYILAMVLLTFIDHFGWLKKTNVEYIYAGMLLLISMLIWPLIIIGYGILSSDSLIYIPISCAVYAACMVLTCSIMSLLEKHEYIQVGDLWMIYIPAVSFSPLVFVIGYLLQIIKIGALKLLT